MVDDAYRMADDIGLDGVRKFESVLNEFKFAAIKGMLKK